MTSTFILAPGESYTQCPYNISHQITYQQINYKNAKLGTHLEKCRKAYIKELNLKGQRARIKICRYNALHHVAENQIRLHEERCEDAMRVVNHLAYHNSEEGSRMYENERKRHYGRDHKSEFNGQSRRQSHYRGRHHIGQSIRMPASSVSSEKSKQTASFSGQSGSKDVKVVLNNYGLLQEDWETQSQSNEPGYDPTVKLNTDVVIYNPQGLTKSERKRFRLETEMRYRMNQESSKMSKTVRMEKLSSTFSGSEPAIYRSRDMKYVETKPQGTIQRKTNETLKYESASFMPRDASSHRTIKTSKIFRSPRGQSWESANRNQSRNSRFIPEFIDRFSSKKTWMEQEKMERTQERSYYPDSDNFEGTDPYA